MVASEHLYQTIVQYDKTIISPRKLAAGIIYDNHFCYCLLVGILERIDDNLEALYGKCWFCTLDLATGY